MKFVEKLLLFARLVFSRTLCQTVYKFQARSFDELSFFPRAGLLCLVKCDEGRFLCLVLVEPKASCYRAHVCVRNLGFSRILWPTTRDHFRAMFVWFSYPEKTWRRWQLFATIAPCAHIARLFNDVGKFSMFKINLSYFPSRARLNFRWIFKEFDLKGNMKGFFENFLALSVKKLKKVLMILPSISGRGRAYPAESCRYMPCLAISNFYRRWNFHNNFQANCTRPYLFFVFVFF